VEVELGGRTQHRFLVQDFPRVFQQALCILRRNQALGKSRAKNFADTTMIVADYRASEFDRLQNRSAKRFGLAG